MSWTRALQIALFICNTQQWITADNTQLKSYCLSAIRQQIIDDDTLYTSLSNSLFHSDCNNMTAKLTLFHSDCNNMTVGKSFIVLNCQLELVLASRQLCSRRHCSISIFYRYSTWTTAILSQNLIDSCVQNAEFTQSDNNPVKIS